MFQQVFVAPRDARYEEVRRLGVYIMRAFTEVAKTNPKVYAELFFYKSIREANDIEYGYDDQRYANGYVIQRRNFSNQITKQPLGCHPTPPHSLLLRIFTIKMVICFRFHSFFLFFARRRCRFSTQCQQKDWLD